MLLSCSCCSVRIMWYGALRYLHLLNTVVPRLSEVSSQIPQSKYLYQHCIVFNDLQKFCEQLKWQLSVKSTVEDKITICKCLDKGSSKREITHECDISKSTVSELFL